MLFDLFVIYIFNTFPLWPVSTELPVAQQIVVRLAWSTVSPKGALSPLGGAAFLIPPKAHVSGRIRPSIFTGTKAKRLIDYAKEVGEFRLRFC